MKPILLSAMALTLWAGASHAACSTASMAGNWRIVGQDKVCNVTISAAGKISNVSCSDGAAYSGTLSLNSSCLLSGTIAGNNVKGRTNPLAASSTAVPTTVVAASSNGNIAFTGFRL